MARVPERAEQQASTALDTARHPAPALAGRGARPGAVASASRAVEGLRSPGAALALQRVAGNAAASRLFAPADEARASRLRPEGVQALTATDTKPLKVQRSFLGLLRRMGRAVRDVFKRSFGRHPSTRATAPGGARGTASAPPAPAASVYGGVPSQPVANEAQANDALQLAEALSGETAGPEKAQPSYPNVLSRGREYKGEELGQWRRIEEFVENAKADLASSPARRQELAQRGINSLGDYMRLVFGWTQQDVQEYLSGDKLVVDKVKVKYLAPDERKEFELLGANPFHQGSQRRVFTTDGMFSKFSGEGYGIYVMDQQGHLYADRHRVGLFHHSSFLAGGDVAAAGELKVSSSGELQHLTSKSGHYRPSPAELWQVVEEMRRRGVSLQSFVVSTFDNFYDKVPAAQFHELWKPRQAEPEQPAPEEQEGYNNGAGQGGSPTGNRYQKSPADNATTTSSSSPASGSGQRYSSTPSDQNAQRPPEERQEQLVQTLRADAPAVARREALARVGRGEPRDDEGG